MYNKKQNTMKRRLQNIISVLFFPIRHQCIFFLMFAILMNYPNMVSLFPISHSNFADFLSALAVPIFISYILTLLIYYSKTKIVKFICYVLLFFFFLFYIFLHNVFSIENQIYVFWFDWFDNQICRNDKQTEVIWTL